MALYRDPVIPLCKTRIIAAVTDQDPLTQTEVKELLRSFKGITFGKNWRK